MKSGHCRRDFCSFQILLMLLLKLAEMLLVVNCWMSNKLWSASIVARALSLPNCGWLVERTFFCFSDEVSGQTSRKSFLEIQSIVRGLLPVWVTWRSGLTRRELLFRVRIIQKTNPYGLLVFWIINAGGFLENHDYMLGNKIASTKSTFGARLRFFLAHSFLSPAGSSFWPKCSGTTT